ncbi:hypothetical protein SAMN05216379_1463 [Nitrosomonas eutropha]|nr:hypothetical protein SAMN05216379_1463 [Nitrosomonas eutropha]
MIKGTVKWFNADKGVVELPDENSWGDSGQQCQMFLRRPHLSINELCSNERVTIETLRKHVQSRLRRNKTAAQFPLVSPPRVNEDLYGSC